MRNPLNVAKYIVIIGTNKWATLKGWTLFPSRDGVCDYFIFDLEGTVPKIMNAGYFKDVWH